MLALIPGSTAFRIFDRRMHEVPPKPHYTKTGYVDESDCAHLRSRLALLHEIADQFGPETLRQIGVAKRQHHIAAGEYGLARRLVYGLMSKAATDLLIVDAYADEAAFPYLESLAPTIRARVLGGRALSPAAKVILEGYQRQGRKFEMRRGSAMHDRYLVIDGTEVWSLGASINGLGAKAHTLTRVDDDGTRATLISELEAE